VERPSEVPQDLKFAVRKRQEGLVETIAVRFQGAIEELVR
jgi:hypothetical protein